MRKLLGKTCTTSGDHYISNSFEKLKSMIEQSSTLKYFNPGQEIYMETDASEKGLGCVLMQPGESGDES